MNADNLPSDGENTLAGLKKPDDFVIRDLMASEKPFEKILASRDAALIFVAALAKRDDELEGGLDEGAASFRSRVNLDGQGYVQTDSFGALRDLLASSREGAAKTESDPKVLCGIGGFLNKLLLNAIVARFADNRDQPAAIGVQRPEFRVKTSGKITDWLFVANQPAPTPPEPNTNKVGSGHGHVAVNILNQEFDTNQALIDCKPSRTEFLHWDIKILDCTVYQRKNDAITNDPYPALTLQFPGHATDPDDGRSIWCRCLNHKLFAQGPHQIEVRHVYRKIDNGPLELLPNDPANPNSPYCVTADDCFDIMFKGFPPAARLPVQREYCLGRCEEPPVVNTGS